jgi:hypothetical protein
MFGYILASIAILLLFIYFVVTPIVTFYQDPKGLRKYPSLNLLCAFSDLGFIWEANKPFRSRALLEAHKTSPVVRIGPNSLSYSDLSAIKVRIIKSHSLILPY